MNLTASTLPPTTYSSDTIHHLEELLLKELPAEFSIRSARGNTKKYSIYCTFWVPQLENVVHSDSYDLRNFYRTWRLLRSHFFSRRSQQPTNATELNLVTLTNLCSLLHLIYQINLRHNGNKLMRNIQ